MCLSSRLHVTTDLQEEAVLFAEKMGWRFEVEEPQMRRTDRQKRFAGYGDNFRLVPSHRTPCEFGRLQTERRLCWPWQAQCLRRNFAWADTRLILCLVCSMHCM